MGADAALKVAVRLETVGIAVPLVVCFDPTSFRLLFGPPPVPKNVTSTSECRWRMSSQPSFMHATWELPIMHSRSIGPPVAVEPERRRQARRTLGRTT
jgi:hypothetical protein